MRRTLTAAIAAAVLACAGIGAAIAASTLTTGTVSVCATATTPGHTVAIDGTPVSTLAGDTAIQCATTTYTVPTETVTTGATTTPTTVTTQTTTTAATTTSSSTPTFASETTYTQTRPAFTVKRTVLVNSASTLKTALANLQPGDLVKASAPFIVANGTTNGLVISNRLSAPAEIDLTGVTVEYTGTGEYFSVWVKNVQNVWLFGGNLTMTQPTLGGGSCIGWTASQHSMWWGFDAHDCGSSGMGVFTSTPAYSFGGPVSYDDIEGTIHHFSLNGGRYDPHQEKCTGIHGANLADNNQFAFDHNRIALNVYDSPCIGGGIEFGSSKSPTTSPSGPIPDSNTIILQCDSFTFISTIQTGGNCYETWGYGETNTDIKYLHATNLTGHPYWVGGMYGSATTAGALKTDTVEYGRASNVRLNPRYAKDANWNTKAGTVFVDVAPLP